MGRKLARKVYKIAKIGKIVQDFSLSQQTVRCCVLPAFCLHKEYVAAFNFGIKQLLETFTNDSSLISLDTGRKFNVNKTFRRRPGRLLNVFSTFNLRPVSAGM